MDKKSQVTIFMVIGLLLILLVAITIYIIKIRAPGEEEVERIATKVPVEFAQVKVYVEGCIRLTAVEALTKLGEHGGYIDMTNSELSGRNFKFIPNDPTESDGLSISEQSFSPIPYWWYLRTENECVDCVVDSASPSIENIQAQLNRYINKNLSHCIRDFEPLKEQNFGFRNIEDVSANTVIAENDIVFNINFPFQASKENSIEKLENFIIIVDLDLREILELAGFIAASEANDQFLEGALLYLISSYSGRDVQKLPPISFTDHELSVVKWSKLFVKELLKQVLMENIPILDVDKTNDAVRVLGNTYQLFFLDILDRNYALTADFAYLNWPVYLEITPSTNDILEPSVTRQTYPLNVVPPDQTNSYEFFYDVSYPVLVTLTDENQTVKDIFGEQGYKFMFALEGNIRDNLDLLNWHLGKGTVGPTTFGGVDFSIAGQQQPARESLFCNTRQRISAEYTIRALDDTQTIDGVSITYGCGTYRSCPIGITAFDESQNEFLFKGQLPICEGGYLLLEKDGFMSKALQLTTQSARDEIVQVQMDKLITKDVSVKKYTMAEPGQCCNLPSDLSQGDRVMMNIDKVVNTNDPFDTGHNQFIMFDSSNPDAAVTQEISLIPGTYEVTINYFDNDGFTIQKECKQYCSRYGIRHVLGVPSGTECKDRDFLPQNNLDIKPAPMGGASLNQRTGYWTVTQQDLDAGNNIEFYFIKAPTPTCIDEATGEDERCMIDKVTGYDPLCAHGLPGSRICDGCIGLDQMSKEEDHSLTFRSFLEPVIS